MSQQENRLVMLKNREEKLSEKVFTIPNLLSFFCFFLIIPFTVMFFLNHVITSFDCIVMSGISDGLDGFLARKLHQTSALGKLLDPIADKLTLLAVMVCFGVRIPEIFPFAIILIVKDVLMVSGGYYLVRRGITLPSAKWYGKTATTVFYFSMIVIVLYRELLGYQREGVTVALFVVTVCVMLFALLNYIRLFFLLMEKKEQ